MQLKNENAQRAGQGSLGGSAVQCDVADVSLPHFPDVFSPSALALALVATGARGLTDDEDAVAELMAMGWPLEVWSVELIGDALVTWWQLSWDAFEDDHFNEWLDQFWESLDLIRLQATGRDRLHLERLDWFRDTEENRTSLARLALPTSATYAAIAARTLEGALK